MTRVASSPQCDVLSPRRVSAVPAEALFSSIRGFDAVLGQSGNTRWVCETHNDPRYWGERTCDCGAGGAPCPVSIRSFPKNAAEVPPMPEHRIIGPRRKADAPGKMARGAPRRHLRDEVGALQSCKNVFRGAEEYRRRIAHTSHRHDTDDVSDAGQRYDGLGDAGRQVDEVASLCTAEGSVVLTSPPLQVGPSRGFGVELGDQLLHLADLRELAHSDP